MSIKVRPFDETIEGARPGTTLEMRGFVRGEPSLSRSSAASSKCQLARSALTSGELSPCSRSASNASTSARCYASGPSTSQTCRRGGEIEIVWERFSRARWEQAARAQGIDTQRVNLMVPPQRSVCVYFDNDGNMNGRETIG
jgi:hypothetical protein